MKEIIYPTPSRISEYNLLVLSLLPAKKKDSSKILSYTKLVNIIENCKDTQGDLYDKAVFLLKGLVIGHAFASGNRRTAFIAAKQFVVENGGKFNIKDEPFIAKVMVGVRERYYTDEEIKEWIKNGTIREFDRFNR